MSHLQIALIVWIAAQLPFGVPLWMLIKRRDRLASRQEEFCFDVGASSVERADLAGAPPATVQVGATKFQSALEAATPAEMAAALDFADRSVAAAINLSRGVS